QLQEIGEDILRLVANETRQSINLDRSELAQRAYDRLLTRYGYQADSVRDALGELLARRYKE
ncbi:MAG: hypothetical protein JWN04_1008, partial [Myxococcaceae bacterium]|nr:hypothetical protein [Myxococcaceae bacterium]